MSISCARLNSSAPRERLARERRGRCVRARWGCHIEWSRLHSLGAAEQVAHDDPILGVMRVAAAIVLYESAPLFDGTLSAVDFAQHEFVQ